METERTDDLPLLLTQMQRMQLAILVDRHIPAHGLRKERSMSERILVRLTPVHTPGGPGPLADVLRVLSDDERDRALEPEWRGHRLAGLCVLLQAVCAWVPPP